ncbi:siderophore-iron reductase FhuF [Thermoflavimicrobium dichotomicum]|uniref:Siderophore-iron reductase FhuF n=1 Tax=Thermoflavimicrobium dichotomicum TaxID=46223 RepID=A0A1I3M0N7_9BACL|nr:siderophore-iron reductase FhuF [Thermoflavimicrobium dichotomicum]
MLRSEEIAFLQEHFCFTQEVSTDSPGMIRTSDLFDEAKCHLFLSQLSALLGSPSLKVTASQFAKRYVYLAILPALYAMSIWDKQLPVYTENSWIESDFKQGRWLPRLRLERLATSSWRGSREKWRDQVLHNLFAENVTTIWRALVRVTGISASILWENAAVYIFWLYEKKLKDLDQQKRLQAFKDFQYLLQADPFLFGETENPLAQWYTSKVYLIEEEELIRVRQTCCLYYQVNAEGLCCRTCPRRAKTLQSEQQVEKPMLLKM